MCNGDVAGGVNFVGDGVREGKENGRFAQHLRLGAFWSWRSCAQQLCKVVLARALRDLLRQALSRPRKIRGTGRWRLYLLRAVRAGGSEGRIDRRTD